MNRVKIYDKYFVPYITNKEITEVIDNVAKKINYDFRDTKEIPVIMCVLNGAIMFTGELLQRLDFECELSSIRLASYEGTHSTGKVKEILGLNIDISGRTIIVVEDIVDTGKTIIDLSKSLREKGAKEVKICTMLLKPEIYSQQEKLDYVGKEIPNRFIVGYGLDYDQLGRNLNEIYVLDE